MTQEIAGWVIAVDRRKGVRADRYYVAFADTSTAKSALSRKLKLSDDAVIEVKDHLTAADLIALKLAPGQVRKS